MMSVIEVALGGDSVGLNGESSGVSDYIIALSELDIIAGSLFTDLSGVIRKAYTALICS